MKVYRKVLVIERLPKVSGEYDTSIGNVCFENVHNKFFNHKGELALDPEWYLEEIELPSDEEIQEESIAPFKNWGELQEEYDVFIKEDSKIFLKGANFILNKLKGE